MKFNVNPVMVLVAIIVAVAVALLSTSFYVVDSTERAVVTMFGRYASIADPGLHFKIPFGIQKNYNVPTEVVQVEQFGFKTSKAGVVSEYDDTTKPFMMLTGDLNVVQVEWVVQYRIVDPKAWQFEVYDRHKTIRDVSQSVINQLIGDSSFVDVTTSARGRLEVAALEMMNAQFRSYSLGITITAVKFQNVEMPEAVKAAFSDVSNAKTDLMRLINEGKEAYNAEIPKSRGEADRLVQVAQGYSTERVNKARGDVARFNSVYEEYRKAPTITKKRLYYEMIEAVFGGDERIDLIDRNLKNFLPLKDLGATGGTK
ncbi:MAG: FtsH protease activity modulator HflK [Spirochaetes bacterium]|nr:FtsH protease activity modulator HflK [Spirochaetota bacterium]